MQKKDILTRVWSVQHPNAGQNIQQNRPGRTLFYLGSIFIKMIQPINELINIIHSLKLILPGKSSTSLLQIPKPEPKIIRLLDCLMM